MASVALVRGSRRFSTLRSSPAVRAPNKVGQPRALLSLRRGVRSFCSLAKPPWTLRAVGSRRRASLCLVMMDHAASTSPLRRRTGNAAIHSSTSLSIQATLPPISRERGNFPLRASRSKLWDR